MFDVSTFSEYGYPESIEFDDKLDCGENSG